MTSPANIIPCIQQLATYAPIFAGNVFGEYVYSQATVDEVIDAPMPFAMVLYDGEEAEENQVMNGQMQMMRVHYSVVICVDASQDLVGINGQTMTAECE